MIIPWTVVFLRIFSLKTKCAWWNNGGSRCPWCAMPIRAAGAMSDVSEMGHVVLPSEMCLTPAEMTRNKLEWPWVLRAVPWGSSGGSATGKTGGGKVFSQIFCGACAAKVIQSTALASVCEEASPAFFAQGTSFENWRIDPFLGVSDIDFSFKHHFWVWPCRPKIGYPHFSRILSSFSLLKMPFWGMPV